MKHQTKLSTSSKSDERYTPDWILDYAKSAMRCSQFDYDPFTTPDNITQATEFTALPSNGLLTDWSKYDNIWINPPFSKMSHVVSKLEEEPIDSKIILLTKAEFRTNWSKRLLRRCKYFVIVNDYVQFINTDNSAIYSVVLWTFNISWVDLKIASDLYPQFIPCAH